MRVTGFLLPGLVLAGIIYVTGIVVTAIAVGIGTVVAHCSGAYLDGIRWRRVPLRILAWPWLVADVVGRLRQIHEHR